MAARYWVGGTASWDGTAGTKWATTSGGAGGASVPTTADDVFFDANSTGTCTIVTGNTGAKSLDCSGFSGTITGTVSISIAGTIYISPTQTYSHTGIVNVIGTGTIITSGKTFSGITVNGTGITVTLGSAVTSSGNISVVAGTLDTAGYTVRASALSSSISTNVRTILLGTSTISLNSTTPIALNLTNLTFDAGTSTINLSASGLTFTGGGATFHNVNFNGTVIGTRTISGTNTFNNFTLTASGNGLTTLNLQGSQTINGTFTSSGSSGTSRGFVSSSVRGTSRVLTCGAIVANFCDFRDITLAGAATGSTVAGDCGGNSGFTFSTPKNVYRVGSSLSWSGTAWALTSGGSASSNNFPNPQDTAIIDNNTTSTSVSPATYNICSIDTTARTSAYTLDMSSTNSIYGSILIGSSTSFAGTANQTFLGGYDQYLTTTGKTATFSIIVDKVLGGLVLNDALISSAGITHIRGVFDAVSYNVTCTTFTSTSAFTRTLNMGSGLWTLTGTGTLWKTASAGLTLNKETANILLSNTTTTARTFAGAGLSYNKLTIGGATGISTLTISGDGTSFTELASIKTVAHTIILSNNLGTVDTWSIKGTAGNVVTFNSDVAGTRRTFNLTNVTTSNIDYLSVRDIGVNQANKFYVGANSTNVSNNLNVIFTSPPAIAYGGGFLTMFL